MEYYTIRTGRKKMLFLLVMLLVLKYLLELCCRNVFPFYSTSFSSFADVKRVNISWLVYIPLATIVSFLTTYKATALSSMFTLLFLLNGVSFFPLYGYKPQTTTGSFACATVFWYIFALCAALPQISADKEKRTIKMATSYRKKLAPAAELPEVVSNKFLMNIILFAAFGSAVALSAVYGNFRLFIAFQDVYEYRFELSMPSIVVYYFRFLSGAILPYLFAVFLNEKRKFCAMLALLGGLFTYGIDGLKTTLLSYIIIAFFYVLCKRKTCTDDYSKIVNYFAFLLTVGTLIVYILFVYYDTKFFSAELFRTIMIPASIADNYYAFIEPREALLLRQSILRAFFESPYEKSISYLVTTQTYNGHASMANTGLFGDAYANFKLFGCVLYPILYCLVFKGWEMLNERESLFLCISVGFIIIWNAINISFFTWLLSGGVLTFFVLAVAKRRLKVRVD